MIMNAKLDKTAIRSYPILATPNMCLLTCCLLSLSAQVFGQDPVDTDDFRIEEIIVTAERREANLQDTPVAVTAFSASDITEAGIQTTQDFIAMTPNVSFDDSFTVGNSFVTVRGVAQINNADSPMAIVIDGVPQNNQKQFKMELFDIERIEILKGPQGALYGRNAIGGAINIVSKQPTNELQGYVVAGFGSGSEIKASGAVSGPIVQDTLFFRIAAAYKDTDGLIDNSYLNTEVDFLESADVRAKLLWLPNDKTSIDARFATSNLKGGAIYDAAFFDSVSTDNTNHERAPITDILGQSEREIDELALKMDFETGLGTFTSITAYTDLYEDYFGDLDFCNPVDCPGGFFGFGQVDQLQELDVQMLSQEFRIVSPSDKGFRWFAGVYGLQTDRDLLTIATLADFGNFPIVNNNESNDNFAWAVFGQLEYDFGANTELSLSLRYDSDRREQTDVATGNKRRETFDAWQPKVTLSHRFSETSLGYLTYARGFRSGGFNGIGGRQFDAETIDSFEAGYKTEFANGRVIMNSSVFYAKDDDFQFFFVDVNAGGAQVIDNLDKTSMLGLEIELKALITRNWEVYAALGVLDTEIDKIDPDLPVPAEIGNKTPKTQDNSLNLGTQFSFPVGSLTGVFRFDYEHRGDKYWHTDNVAVMGPVNLLHLRASLQSESWALTLWGRNITDEFYYQDFNAVAFTGLPWDIGWPSRGESWGLEFRYQF